MRPQGALPHAPWGDDDGWSRRSHITGIRHGTCKFRNTPNTPVPEDVWDACYPPHTHRRDRAAGPQYLCSREQPVYNVLTPEFQMVNFGLSDGDHLERVGTVHRRWRPHLVTRTSRCASGTSGSVGARVRLYAYSTEILPASLGAQWDTRFLIRPSPLRSSGHICRDLLGSAVGDSRLRRLLPDRPGRARSVNTEMSRPKLARSRLSRLLRQGHGSASHIRLCHSSEGRSAARFRVRSSLFIPSVSPEILDKYRPCRVRLDARSQSICGAPFLVLYRTGPWQNSCHDKRMSPEERIFLWLIQE